MAIVLVQKTIAVIQKTIAVVQMAIAIVQKTIAVKQMAIAIVQKTIATIQMASAIVQKTIAVVQMAIAIVQKTIAVIQKASVLGQWLKELTNNNSPRTNAIATEKASSQILSVSGDLFLPDERLKRKTSQNAGNNEKIRKRSGQPLRIWLSYLPASQKTQSRS
jgi:hypothetical protein